ncbi:Signal transduction histidine kinase [Sinosporangium album]|uniref:histidine kinase n=1 Tax=Sinosporangium album TaxID=504805 RepID=A0A1G7SE74_9ACTN|nr:sensor histidine kinase [Sinosporangium album]SDG21367.1 Signal transduction histidine kinase [Sinosporangium album]
MAVDDRGTRRRPAVRSDVYARGRATLDALERLVGGCGTGIVAMIALLLLAATALLCLIGVGLLLVPAALRELRAVADRERARLSRWGPGLVGPGTTPSRLRDAVADRAVRRELGWLVIHAGSTALLGALALVLPVEALTSAAFSLGWWLLEEEAATKALGLWAMEDVPSALGITLLILVWIAITVIIAPVLARLQAWPGLRLLRHDPDPGIGPDIDVDLALRAADPTAIRAAALDAHATELRRIERSLHDGTQNRLVAVNMLLGAARRALERDPSTVREPLMRAQYAVEQAHAELRKVVRSILPPVLSDLSLADALSGLAATSPVPCTMDADIPAKAAASVEAAVYFLVAEALTNIAKHGHARHIAIKVRCVGDRLHVQIVDDGRGGADEHNGSGLRGIRSRVEAHVGTFALDSPRGGPTVLTVSLPCGP